MNQKIIVTVGISGSGKSTWATEYIKDDSSYYRVNRDSFRMMITSSDSRYLDRESEKLVTKMQHECIRTLLLDGKNVIIDNTHLNQKYIDEIKMQFNHLADIEVRFFPINPAEAISRVFLRDNSDTTYIVKQGKQFTNVHRSWSYASKVTTPRQDKTYTYTNDDKQCVICDLDGTLSLYDSSKSAYDRDFENDDINAAVALYLSCLADLYENLPDDFMIFFFSGRNGKFRKQTEEFLGNIGGLKKEDYTLVMRDEKDMRRDSVVKQEMFDNHVRGKYMVHCVFDDRLQVIEEVWNPLGLNVLNCNQTNHRF